MSPLHFLLLLGKLVLKISWTPSSVHCKDDIYNISYTFLCCSGGHLKLRTNYCTILYLVHSP